VERRLRRRVQETLNDGRGPHAGSTNWIERSVEDEATFVVPSGRRSDASRLASLT
jgi:hypothetical protein